MNIADLYSFIKGYLRAKKGSYLSKMSVINLQKRLFNDLSKNTLISSPYYSKYTGEDLSNFPVINKKVHMENFDRINTQSLSRDEALRIAIESEASRDFDPEYNEFSVGLSSGTSGSRGLFVLSSRERSLWAGYIIGKMLPFTLRKQKVAFFLRANNNLYETSNGLFLIFKFFDLLEGVESSTNSLDKFSPSILIAPASVLKRIAESETSICPKRIISVAEVLDGSDREIIERRFQLKVEQIYQCTEGFLAASCSDGGIHLNEDAYIIEKKWIDKSTGRFSPIVTDLNRCTQPVIRYLLDDILKLKNEPCPCGSSMTRIEKIEGRCDDIILIKSTDKKTVDVFPDFLRNAIVSSCEKVENYRVIQVGERDLTIEVSPLNEEIVHAIDRSLKKLWARLSIDFPRCDYIEYQLGDMTQKQRRVVREYNG